MELGDLKVRISADVTQLSRGIQQAQAKMQALGPKLQSVGSSMQNVGKSMSMAVTLPILAMGKLGLDELKEIQAANAQTAAAIKRVGAGALVSADGIREQAGALQKLSGMDDQAIQSAQNLLLTQGNLNVKTKAGAAAFEKASRVMVDYAAATGKEPVAAAKGLAKALADPVNNLKRLGKEAGMTKVQQEALAKKMEALKDPAARQALLLDTLSEKYKGSAAAAGETLGAKLAVLKDRLAGVSATFIEKLIPAVDAFSGWASKLLGFVEGLSPAHQKWAAILAVVAAAAGPVLIIVGSLVSAIGALLPVIAALMGPIGLIIVGVAALGVALVLLWRRNEAFRDGVKAAWASVKSALMSTLSSLRATIAQWVSWGQQIWRQYGDQIKSVATAAWGALSGIISGRLQFIKGYVQTWLAIFRGDWSGAWNGVKTMLSGIWDVIKGIVRLGVTAVKAYLGLLKEAITQLPAKLASAARDVGNAIIDGIVAGIRAGAGKIADAAKAAARKALDAAKDALGIKSPSSVMRDQVGVPIAEGVARGITKGSKKATAAAIKMAKEVTGILERAARAFSYKDAVLDLKSALAGDDDAGVKKETIDANKKRYDQLANDLGRKGITAEQRTANLSEMASIARENKGLAEEIAEIQTRARAAAVANMDTSGVDDVATAAAQLSKDTAEKGLAADIAQIIASMMPALALPKFARGGVTSGPSLAGEAGREAVIPLGGSAQNAADRARVMREAGLNSGGGMTFVFNGADVDMFAVAQSARFQMMGAGLAS